MRSRTFVILSIAVGICLFTGCASKGMLIDQGLSQDQVNKSIKKDEQTDEFLQSQLEKQLVLVFIALLQMDKRPDLGITSKQAELLLPVVQKAIAIGEWSQDEQNVLIGALSAQQQLSFEEISAQMRSRGLNRKSGPPPGLTLTKGQREALMEDLKQRRLNEDDPGGSGFPYRENKIMPDLPAGKNVEQQLVDVLERKKVITLTK